MRCRVCKINPQKVGIYQHIQNLKFLDRVAFCSRVILLTLTTLIFFPPALGLMDTTATPTPSTTTLTLATSDVSLIMSSYGTDGSFVASDPATISIATNNYTGYTLGLRASSIGENATKLINENNNTLDSISSASDPADFNIGNWGYLPSKINGAANAQYQPAPTNAGVTLDSTTTANSTANDYTITLGTKAGYTTDPGTYENTFIITATANPVTYSITYDKNTTDAVANLPETQAGNVESTDITISSLTPTRTGYIFTGWCNASTTTSNGIDSCSGTTYVAGSTYSTSQTTTNNLSLKAMWSRRYTITFNRNDGTGTTTTQTATGNTVTLASNSFSRTGYNFLNWNTASGGTGTTYNNGASYTVATGVTNVTLYARWDAYSFNAAFAVAGKSTVAISGTAYYKMQDMTSGICSDVDTSQQTQLADSRDNKIYWVLKAKDGHCWMTQNLDLNLDSSRTYTPSDTDLTSNWRPVRSTINATGGGTVSGWANSTTSPYSFDVGNWYWIGSYYNSGGNNYQTGSPGDKFSRSPYSGNGTHGHVGNYYNWTAAVAMNDSSGYKYSTYSNPNNSPQTSICPEGWRLPTISSVSGRNEFRGLLNAYGGSTSTDSTFVSSPIYTVRNGSSDNGVIYNPGAGGHYWSSTVYDANRAYRAWSSATAVIPEDVSDSNRISGSPVRCIAR